MSKRVFTGDNKELEAIHYCETVVKNTGKAHSIVAITSTELTVIPAAEAGARALETIRP